MKVPVFEPVAMVIVAGTEATTESELLKAIVTPGAGAMPVRVTVPVTVVCDPPTTVEGANVTP